MDITRERLEKLVLDHFGGVGNVYDEPEDIESLREIIDEMWEELEGEIRR